MFSKKKGASWTYDTPSSFSFLHIHFFIGHLTYPIEGHQNGYVTTFPVSSEDSWRYR